MKTDFPWDETERLAALHAYGILDTEPERAFDEIVDLLREAFDVPSAVVSLIDTDRAWFKAAVGTRVRQSLRAVSFCNEMILGDGEQLVVTDASRDPRFSGNPHVTGEPGIRFYAGHVLRSDDGLPMGAICVFSPQPRPEGISPFQSRLLEVMAGQVMAQVELRRTLNERDTGIAALARREARLGVIADSTSRIVGSSAADGTDINHPKWVEDGKDLVDQELNHRIKNVFAVISSLIALSARQHPQARDFALSARGRINALARAHEFVRPYSQDTDPGGGATTLHAFLAALFQPHVGEDQQARVMIEGEDVTFDDQAATAIALLFHELATNAAKYGALSNADGRVVLRTSSVGDRFLLIWKESGGPPVIETPLEDGFGSVLSRSVVEGQLDGRLERTWLNEGLRVEVDLPAAALSRRRQSRMSA